MVPFLVELRLILNIGKFKGMEWFILKKWQCFCCLASEVQKLQIKTSVLLVLFVLNLVVC
jgi:hypothetical protein